MSQYQQNAKIEPDADPKKYEVGRLLRFVRHSPGETIRCHFHCGDLITVRAVNGCGMGIDCDGPRGPDMVWPDEVRIARWAGEEVRAGRLGVQNGQ